MYKINDYVVYRHDVCKVKNIIKNDSTGQVYYVISPVDDDSLIIDVPVENKMGFLRNIISKDAAVNLVNKINIIEPLDNINDKSLEIQYKELLGDGSHDSLIKIIKTTYIRNEKRLNNNKKISEKDDSFFKLAEKYLYNELAISLDKSVSEIKEYISEEVKKNEIR